MSEYIWSFFFQIENLSLKYNFKFPLKVHSTAQWYFLNRKFREFGLQHIHFGAILLHGHERDIPK